MRTRIVHWRLLLGLGVAVGCGGNQGADNSNQQVDAGDASPVARCGDGRVDVGEQCDDGELNSDFFADACRSSCRSPFCGDHVTDTGEGCDDGSANSDRLANACRTACALPGCGDGVIDADEGCDDGNASAGDGCGTVCLIEPHFDCDGLPSNCVCQDFYQGASCGSCVVYVDVLADPALADGLSWATAFDTIQPALDAAHDAGASCEVWVTGGTYHLSQWSVVETLELRSHVALYGGFAGTETQRDQRDWQGRRSLLLGQDPDGWPVHHALTAIGTIDATVDGFVIAGARASGATAEDRRGAGLYAYGAKLTFAHCVFAGNHAMGEGGAIYSYGSQIFVEDSIFSLNAAAPQFAAPEVNGGAIVAEQSLMLLTGVVFAGNFATGNGGALYNANATVYVASSTLVGNLVGGLGGGLYHDGCGVTLLSNVTVVGNTAALGGGVGRDPVSTCLDFELRNSLLWYNLSSTATASAIAGNIIVQHSGVQDGVAQSGMGNLNEEPQFLGLPLGGGQLENVWSEPNFQMALLDAEASWVPGSLAGRYLRMGGGGNRWYLIADNTATELFVWGDDMQVFGDYQLFDLSLLPDSAGVDTGNDGLVLFQDVDLNGVVRLDLAGEGTPGTLTDMGAYECQGAVTESDCGDQLDNDGDGLTDCFDADCPFAPPCETTESSCDDGLDNDADGLTDCADPHCTGVGACEQPEVSCGDGLDNDGDGAPDCADSDCVGGLPCEAVEQICDDGFDNDADGASDCDDADCNAALYCQLGGRCWPATVLQCGGSLDSDNSGGVSTLASYGCSIYQYPGTESIIRFQHAQDTTVSFSLTNMSADLDMFLLPAGQSGACHPELGCLAQGATLGDEFITFQAVAGQDYYLAIEGWAGATGSYTLSAACSN